MRNGVYEYPSGHRQWYLNGKYHREDGPAVEYPNGDREWWINDRLHRLDGPAFEGVDGTCEWWIDGEEYTEEEYEHEMRLRKSEILLRKWGLSVDA